MCDLDHSQTFDTTRRGEWPGLRSMSLKILGSAEEGNSWHREVAYDIALFLGAGVSFPNRIPGGASWWEISRMVSEFAKSCRQSLR